MEDSIKNQQEVCIDLYSIGVQISKPDVVAYMTASSNTLGILGCLAVASSSDNKVYVLAHHTDSTGIETLSKRFCIELPRIVSIVYNTGINPYNLSALSLEWKGRSL